MAARKPPRVLTADEVRAEREQRGLSQAEFADRLGVDVMTVSRWERGARTPPAMLEVALRAMR
jgi:DNA-binding transcriptional regulator YiaG